MTFYDSVYHGVVDGTEPLVGLNEARQVIEILHRCRGDDAADGGTESQSALSRL